MKAQYKSVWIADFETRNSPQAIAEGETWVTSWACCNMKNYKDVAVGTMIETFIAFCKQIAPATIYFHNARFDCSFILYYLFKNGWNQVTDTRPTKTWTFSTLYGSASEMYQLNMKFGKGLVQIRDSSKKLQGSVASIGKAYKTEYQKLEYDYELERLPGQPLTPDEEEYVKNDVRVVAEALNFSYEHDCTKLTIASDALTDYKRRLGGNKKFREYFPKLSPDIHNFCREAYAGGICMVKPEVQGKPIHLKGYTGVVLDVCSLYPSMMSSKPYYLYSYGKKVKHINRFPVGQPFHFEGVPDPTEKQVWIAHIKCSYKLKEGFCPTIKTEDGNRFGSTVDKWSTQSEGITNMIVTSVDFEVMSEHYNLEYLDFVEGYMFDTQSGLFDDYISYWLNIKNTSTGALRQLAKIMLNSLYGKFGQTTSGESKKPYYNEEKDCVSMEKYVGEDREPVYMPMACFITAYARRFTFNAIQENWEYFCYSDTDSVHLICPVEKVKGIEIGYKELCKWDLEGVFDTAIYARQKTYMEHVKTDTGGKWDIKCAGLPEGGKNIFLNAFKSGEVQLKDFAPGLVIKDCKLMPKQVRGGCILVPADFKLRGEHDDCERVLSSKQNSIN